MANTFGPTYYGEYGVGGTSPDGKAMQLLAKALLVTMAVGAAAGVVANVDNNHDSGHEMLDRLNAAVEREANRVAPGVTAGLADSIPDSFEGELRSSQLVDYVMGRSTPSCEFTAQAADAVRAQMRDIAGTRLDRNGGMREYREYARFFGAGRPFASAADFVRAANTIQGQLDINNEYIVQEGMSRTLTSETPISFSGRGTAFSNTPVRRNMMDFVAEHYHGAGQGTGTPGREVVIERETIQGRPRYIPGRRTYGQDVYIPGTRTYGEDVHIEGTRTYGEDVFIPGTRTYGEDVFIPGRRIYGEDEFVPGPGNYQPLPPGFPIIQPQPNPPETLIPEQQQPVYPHPESPRHPNNQVPTTPYVPGEGFRPPLDPGGSINDGVGQTNVGSDGTANYVGAAQNYVRCPQTGAIVRPGSARYQELTGGASASAGQGQGSTGSEGAAAGGGYYLNNTDNAAQGELVGRGQ